MNTGIIIDCSIIIGCAMLGFVPFDKKRIRAGWAKVVFGLIAVVGIIKGSVILAWDLRWITVGNEAGRALNNYNCMAGGVILGFLFSLILSGQLLGKKRNFIDP